MNGLDQYVKNDLRARHYIRYADDFVVLSRDKPWLVEVIPKIADFLKEKLALDLHPDKIFIKTLSSGVDFLGWVHFPDHLVLRTKTRRRMLARLKKSRSPAALASYKGLLKHGNAYKLSGVIE